MPAILPQPPNGRYGIEQGDESSRGHESADAARQEAIDAISRALMRCREELYRLREATEAVAAREVTESPDAGRDKIVSGQ